MLAWHGLCRGRSTGVPFYPRRRHSGHVSLKYPRRSNVEGGARFALEENDLYRRKDTLLMSLSPKTSLSLAILAGLGLAAAHPANAQLYRQPPPPRRFEQPLPSLLRQVDLYFLLL